LSRSATSGSYRTGVDVQTVGVAMSDPEIRALGSKFDINILEEASYVLWYIWRAIHPRFSTLQACIGALTNDAKLYKVLKSAHGCGNYDLVRYWGASLTFI
jgi:hypothetical protein